MKIDYVDYPFESPVILSFCPGILGLERGLERAIGPIRIAAYVEIEAFILENLVAGMETGILDPAPIWTDVKTFNAKTFRGKIHGIIGGYPCQPFSTAGKQLGEQDPRHLWPYICKHIENSKPIWCFFENVAAHLKLGYRTVRQELEQLGYTVKEGIYSAEEIGAPHQRKRLLFLAILGNSKSFNKCNDWYESAKSKIKTGRSSIELADSRSERLQEVQSGMVYREGSGISGPITKCCSENFPLGQGPNQHEWEHPRTLKPGLGCTADGYNFRPDLLRAFDNSVVEQTAELAFLDLLRKHLTA